MKATGDTNQPPPLRKASSSSNVASPHKGKELAGSLSFRASSSSSFVPPNKGKELAGPLSSRASTSSNFAPPRKDKELAAPLSSRASTSSNFAPPRKGKDVAPPLSFRKVHKESGPASSRRLHKQTSRLSSSAQLEGAPPLPFPADVAAQGEKSSMLSAGAPPSDVQHRPGASDAPSVHLAVSAPGVDAVGAPAAAIVGEIARATPRTLEQARRPLRLVAGLPVLLLDRGDGKLLHGDEGEAYLAEISAEPSETSTGIAEISTDPTMGASPGEAPAGAASGEIRPAGGISAAEIATVARGEPQPQPLVSAPGAPSRACALVKPLEVAVSYDSLSQLVLPWKRPRDADDAVVTLIERARDEYGMMAKLRRRFAHLTIGSDTRVLSEQVIRVLESLAPPVPRMRSISLLAEFGARLLRRKFALHQPQLTDWVRGALSEWEHSDPLRQRIERALAIATPLMRANVQLSALRADADEHAAALPALERDLRRRWLDLTDERLAEEPKQLELQKGAIADCREELEAERGLLAAAAAAVHAAPTAATDDVRAATEIAHVTVDADVGAPSVVPSNSGVPSDVPSGVPSGAPSGAPSSVAPCALDITAALARADADLADLDAEEREIEARRRGTRMQPY